MQLGLKVLWSRASIVGCQAPFCVLGVMTVAGALCLAASQDSWPPEQCIQAF
jgi:hypothetical protein